MLVDKFFYYLITIPAFALVIYLVLRHQIYKNKKKEYPNEDLAGITFLATIIFSVFCWITDRSVILVTNTDYKVCSIVGPLKYEFQNGEKVRIKKKSLNIIINDSDRTLILESVDYGFSFGPKDVSFINAYTYVTSPHLIS
jgi:hypothetical protein